MSEQIKGEAFYRVPTLYEKIYRKLGFVYHLGDEPEGIDALKGWMQTDIHLHFDWRDRLRLLISGRLFIASIVHTDTPSPSVCKSRVDYRIIAPREQ